jgi:hypothetical protein
MPHHRHANIDLENLEKLSRAELRMLWTEELAEKPPLIRSRLLGRCQAENPLIGSSKISRPALGFGGLERAMAISHLTWRP